MFLSYRNTETKFKKNTVELQLVNAREKGISIFCSSGSYNSLSKNRPIKILDCSYSAIGTTVFPKSTNRY